MKGYRKDTGAHKDNCILDITLEPASDPWQIGNHAIIRWTATGTSPMLIELIRPGYGHFTITPSAPNSGTFNWKIPHSLTEGKYRLSITADFDWRSRVGTNVNLINREEDRQPCCIVAPSASDTVQVGSLTRIIWTPAQVDHAGQRKHLSSGAQLELKFHSSNGNVTSIATGIEDAGSLVVEVPTISEFAATDRPFVRGRFCLFSSTFSKTCGDVVLIDSPPASIVILNDIEDESFPVARNSSQEVVWSSIGLARAPCEGNKPSSCQLTILTILDGAIVNKIENVPNTGLHVLQTPARGAGRLEVRIYAPAERWVWDQQLLGNLTEQARIDNASPELPDNASPELPEIPSGEATSNMDADEATSNSKAAGIAGGVVGGVFAIVALICILAWSMKSGQRKEPSDDSIVNLKTITVGVSGGGDGARRHRKRRVVELEKSVADFATVGYLRVQQGSATRVLLDAQEGAGNASTLGTVFPGGNKNPPDDQPDPQPKSSSEDIVKVVVPIVVVDGGGGSGGGGGGGASGAGVFASSIISVIAMVVALF